MTKLGLALAVLATLAACEETCGDAMYPRPDPVVKGQTGSLTRTEKGWFGSRTFYDLGAMAEFFPDRTFPVRDVEVGTGEPATPYRQFRLEVEAEATVGGRWVQEAGRVTFLFPKAEADQYHSLGRVPSYFHAALEGMRVGGRRAFTPPDTDEAPMLRDGETKRQVFPMIPDDVPRRYVIRLVAMCRPEVCVRTVYSVPSNKTRELLVKSCD